MKRLRIATKLAIAIVPIALVALAAGGLVTWDSLQEAEAEERVSNAGAVALHAVDSLLDVSSEQGAAIEAALADDETDLTSIRSRVDTELEQLTDAAQVLARTSSGAASGIAAGIVSDTRRVARSLEEARAGDPLGQETNEIFDEIGSTLISVVQQSTFYFDDESRQREGAGATALARASFASFQQERLIARSLGGGDVIAEGDLEQTLRGLESTVSDWLETADEASPTVSALGLARTQILDPEEIGDLDAFPAGRNDVLVGAAADIVTRVAAAADVAAEESREEAVTIAAVVGSVLLAALIMSLLVGRSMVRRVRSVTEAARTVADVELPKLVHSLRDPRGQLAATTVQLEEGGTDEVGELARSFRELHRTLVDVAGQQMDILRRGVSEIFVTLARRNRSLVDRQLALIDELESGEEDPEVLGGYYKLDHLSTRMRRNAESLLVLAGAENPRLWSEPLEMDDVVRAALGEVDDYQRVDVLALEPARLAGKAVTDLSHLMSELLDNATQFSPPTERVRVAGLFDDDGYVLTISDNGVGMSEERLAEFNRLMVEPPVLGLALDPTLGMYVVARLAARHGIAVKLVAGVPGTTVRITLPRTLLDSGQPETPAALATTGTSSAGARVVAEPDRRGVAPAAEPSPPPSRPVPAPAADTRPAVASTEATRTAPSAPGSSPSAPAPSARPSPGEAGRSAAGADGRPDPRSATVPPIPPRNASHRRDGSPAHPPVPPGPPAARSGEGRPPPTGAPTPVRPATGAGDSRGAGTNPPPSPSRANLPRRPEPGSDPTPPARPAAPPTSPPRVARPVDSPPPPADLPTRSSGERPGDRPPTNDPSAVPGLPTREPGTSFREEGDAPDSSSPSRRGAEGIRDALVGYRLGRDTASRSDENRPADASRDDPDGPERGER